MDAQCLLYLLCPAKNSVVNAELNVLLYGVAQGAAITLNRVERFIKASQIEQAMERLRVLEYTRALDLVKLYDGALPVNDSLLQWRYDDAWKVIRSSTATPAVIPRTSGLLSDKVEKAAFYLTELLAELNTQRRDEVFSLSSSQRSPVG